MEIAAAVRADDRFVQPAGLTEGEYAAWSESAEGCTRLQSLRQLYRDALTEWNEGVGAAVEEFWRRVAANGIAAERKQDIVDAKNYLTEEELDTLNRLVTIFLETAELRARRQTLTPMAFWQKNVGQIITANGFPLLSGAGSVSHARMEQKVGTPFLEYDQRRKTQEAQAADAQDEAELNALESRIKRRTGKSS